MTRTGIKLRSLAPLANTVKNKVKCMVNVENIFHFTDEFAMPKVHCSATSSLTCKKSSDEMESIIIFSGEINL